MKIPRWLDSHLDETGIGKIRTAVHEAELKSSAEIVPMVVRASTQTGHVLPMVFFALLALFWGSVPYFSVSTWMPAVPYWSLESGALIVAAAGAWILSRFEFIRAICTKRHDRVSSALLRAQLEFHECGIRRTEGRTGVLIFVSLFEHRVVVLADEAIVAKLPEKTWEDLVSRLTAKIREGDFTGGMVSAIGACGDLLAQHFPRSPNDRDELPNRLIIEE